MNSQSLNKIAERLGLQEETNVVKKCEELLRVLQAKVMLQKINENAKAVLCLQLSCSLFGIGFDKETAMKLCGLKRSTYQNHFNMLETLLDLDKLLTIGELCVQLSCTAIKEIAEKILWKYGKEHQMADLKHPQYIAVSVFSACKLRSIKVDKSKFIAISRLKPSQWKELENDFVKFVEKMEIKSDRPKKSKTNEMYDFLDEAAAKYENSSSEISGCKEQVETYEDWKERILAVAKKAILES